MVLVDTGISHIFILRLLFSFRYFFVGSNRLSAPPEMNQSVKIVDESHQWSDAGMEVREVYFMHVSNIKYNFKGLDVKSFLSTKFCLL